MSGYRTRTQKFKIISRECPISGGLGLAFDKTPDTEDINSAFKGRLLAHDVLEHVNGLSKIGSVEDELQALACVWAIRGQYWDIHPVVTPIESLNADLVMLVRYLDLENMREQKLNSRYCEEDVNFKDILDFHNFHYWKDVWESERDEELTSEDFELWYKYCLHWFRVGWRKAKKKYPCFTQANTMFKRIEEEINKIIKYGIDFEGQEWQLVLNWQKDSCNIEEVEKYLLKND